MTFTLHVLVEEKYSEEQRMTKARFQIVTVSSPEKRACTRWELKGKANIRSVEDPAPAEAPHGDRHHDDRDAGQDPERLPESGEP